ncbi:MAG: DUF1569 domain-containing protein [Planctomycetales bacterium]|nr:DUF1569 domain-containing protein [Planctomycetales bacterium]
MTATTTPAAGRRELSFATMEEMLADAQRLVESPGSRTTGHWPLERLLSHLAYTIHGSIDGFGSTAPWFVRLIAPFLKGGILKKMSPGIKLPEATVSAAFPDYGSPAEALERLRAAVERAKSESMVAPHPAFGKMTHDEWYRLHLRHAEMHLSFARAE